MKSLDGKVVAITGAASGIGRELALQSAERGARLAISDWDAEGLAETAALARERRAGDLFSDVVDVSDRTQVGAWAGAVVERFGGVDMLVNNAGVTVTGDFEEMTYEDFDWIVGVNFHGVVNGTKEFLPHLIASGDGHLVNISSLFGFMSMPGQTAYNATKYAVRGFSEALREEMLINRHPVAVTCVHPGGVKTGIARNGRKTRTEDAEAIDRLFEEKLARTSPASAARTILKGALRKKPRVMVGPDAHVLHQLVKLSGPWYQDVVVHVARRTMPSHRNEAGRRGAAR